MSLGGARKGGTVMTTHFRSRFFSNEVAIPLYPNIAGALGSVNEALVLQQINFWLMRSDKVREDRVWVYNTAKQWHAQFHFWSIDTIKRTLASLREKGVVIAKTFSDNPLDRTLWYTIDEDKLGVLVEAYEASLPVAENGLPAIAQNRTPPPETSEANGGRKHTIGSDAQPPLMQVAPMPVEDDARLMQIASMQEGNLPQCSIQEITLQENTSLADTPKHRKQRKSNPKPKPKKEPVVYSEAVSVYRDEVRRTPGPATRDIIDSIVTDSALWRRVVEGAILRKWNPGNVDLMLDVYKAGGFDAWAAAGNGYKNGNGYNGNGNSRSGHWLGGELKEVDGKKIRIANYSLD